MYQYKCVESTDHFMDNKVWKEPLRESYISYDFYGTIIDISLEGEKTNIYINWKFTDDMENEKQMETVKPDIVDNIATFKLEHPYPNYDTIEIKISIDKNDT